MMTPDRPDPTDAHAPNARPPGPGATPLDPSAARQGPTSSPLTPEVAAALDAADEWDPLAAQRSPEDPPLDVLLSGTVFFDIVFTGLERQPKPGEELWSKGMGSSPGGIANLAVAAARLGLRTGLVAGFGDDAYADWMWHTMAHEEGIDLSASRRFPDFHSPLTASVATQGDRAMV
ncbi:carbohydrate kinase family protein, partial [Brachybacterium tyrofermentans]